MSDVGSCCGVGGVFVSEGSGFVEYQDGWAVQARGLQGEEINWVFDLEGSPASLLEVVNSRGESVTVPVSRDVLGRFVAQVWLEI